MSTRVDQTAEDVPRNKRVWYRHRENGELAYLVRIGEKTMLQLDRPGQQLLRKLNDDWVEEHSRYELMPMQRALVALEADKALCKLLGLVPQSRRDWTMMRPAERVAWMENGPEPVNDSARDGVRKALWKSTMAVLEKLR